jgi:hypothetical protein
MKEEQKVIGLDKYEVGAVIEGLNRLRTEQLAKDESSEFVSDLMLRIIHTRAKKVRSRDEAR